MHILYKNWAQPFRVVNRTESTFQTKWKFRQSDEQNQQFSQLTILFLQCHWFHLQFYLILPAHFADKMPWNKLRAGLFSSQWAYVGGQTKIPHQILKTKCLIVLFYFPTTGRETKGRFLCVIEVISVFKKGWFAVEYAPRVSRSFLAIVRLCLKRCFMMQNFGLISLVFFLWRSGEGEERAQRGNEL